MRRLALLGLLFVAAILSCGKDVTGPLSAAGRFVRGLSWEPIFPAAFQAAGGAGSGIVQFSRVHVVLHHSDGTVALDTTINFPAGADSITLDLTVKLLDNAPPSGEPMTLNLGYLNAAGDTVFKGGPVSVTASPPPAGGGSNPPVHVPVSYTGPGSNAVLVAISPRSGTVVSGGGFSFTAIAKDVNGVTLAGTPIIWNSLDPSIATITSAAAGNGLAQNQRGTARIIAQLLTGPADTVQLFVLLPASNIVAQSGNGQFGVVGTQLALPLVVKVAATDGVGVAGTTVHFAVATGGGSVGSVSAISDANGLAQTTFKLGTGTGAQTVTATAAGLNNSPVTFIDTAQAATASQLVVTTQPVSGVAGTALTAIVVTAEDNNGNIATAFTGPVTVAFGTNTPGATLSGTATVNAVAGVATFSTLTVNKNGTAYTLVASSTGLTSATTSAFDIAVGTPNKLVFTVQPTGAIANVAMTPAIVANAQDSQGNPTPSFTGAVTLGFALNPSAAMLGGTLTVNAVAGVATFAGVSVSTAGTGYALSASSAGLTSATSQPFSITAAGGVATQLVITRQPVNTTAGVAIAPPITVTAKDAGNSVVATFTGSVTLALSANPGGSTLGGTLSVAAVAGVATFSNITLNKAATGYTLVSSSGALTPATSGTFNITSAAATTLAISAGQAQSGNTGTALATPLAVLVTDAFANPVPGVTVNWATPSGGSPAPVTSTTNAAGVATSAWTLGASTGAQTATATSAGLTGSPATFNATATVTGYSKTWTGTTSTAWATATNWAPNGVPAPGDSVYIASGANQPTISAAVTVTHLTIGGGVLTLGGNAVSVLGNFMTSGTGILVMNNALDSLFVVGQATFAGGAEAGSLTNGVLVLFQGIAVSAAGQFNASGSHVTYMVGPHLVCEICDVLTRGRQSVLAGAIVHSASSTMAARRAAAAAAATGARAAAAALSAAREALAAKWPSRAAAARAAAVAGTTVNGLQPPAPMRTSSPRASATVGRPDVRFDVAPGARLGGRTLAASIAVQPYSASAVLVAFADTTGNQFANVRVVGSAQWQTYARAAGNVQVDTTGAIEGSGRLAIAGNLVGSYNSAVAPEAVELFGVLSDTGYFSPDTTVFSGTSQTMPSWVGSGSPYYNNVVVNSPALGVLAEDGTEIDIWGSLFIQNSGQLRIGAPDVNCNGCISDYIYLYGALETHGSGTLRMNDANQPYLVVYGNALFAGGSSTGLLTQGEIEFYANFTQSSPSTTSYVATATHESYFGASVTPLIVTFATPGYASSHFGTLYFGDTITVLMSNVFADGQLQTGGGSSFVISSALDHLVTSRGANLRNLVFDNVRWETTDVGSGSGTFPSIDNVTFQNISNTTAPQFDFEYPVTTSLTLAGFSFLTTPTGAGSYIKVVGPDTLTMTSVTPAFNSGFLSLSGFGAVVNWPALPATHLAFSISPSTTVAGASIAPAIVVQAKDAGNALATSFTGNVTLAIGTNPGASTLSGTVTVAAVAGVATFNDISLNKVGTGYTLTAASTSLTGATSSSFNVTAGPLATITVTPASATLTVSGTQQFTAVGKDASGNVVAITLTWSVVASGGTIGSTGLFTAGTTPGTFTNTVTATSGAISGTATVTVTIAFASLTAGFSHTCGLDAGGAAYCWGLNSSGELGDGTTTSRSAPTLVLGGLSFTSLTAGQPQTCGLTAAGAAYCWGNNSSGQLGDGTSTPRLTPTPVTGGLVFTSLTGGQFYNCGLTAAGAAYCWGLNGNGQLGDSTTNNHITPMLVKGGLVFSSLTAGDVSTCGLIAGGAAYCWGANFYGELGDGTTTAHTKPMPVTGGLTFTSLSASKDLSTCGLTTGGAAYCWGYNNYGQTGDGTTTSHSSPTPVQGSLLFTSLTVGFTDNCGLTAGGVAYCWGQNFYGEVGDGTTATPRSAPTLVSGGVAFAKLTAGSYYTCGLTAAGVAYCWGSNGDGELGDGTITDRSVPTPVIP